MSEYKLYNTALERAVFRQLFPGNHGKFREYLLAHLGDDSFYYEPVQTAYNLLRLFVKKRGELPDYGTLMSDSRMSPSTFDVVRNYALREDNPLFITSEKQAKEAVDELHRLAYCRRIQRSLNDVQDVLRTPGVDLEEVQSRFMELAEDVVREGSSDDDDVYTFGVNDEELFKYLIDPDREPEFYTTPFESFNNVCGGIPRSGLMLVGAVTSGGKSAMANQLSAHLVREHCLRGRKYSLELPAKQEYFRYCAQLAQVSLKQMRFGGKLTSAEISRIRAARKDWEEFQNETGSRLDFQSAASLSVEKMFMRARPYNYDFIIVDYVGLMEGADDDQQALRLSQITRAMKVETQKVEKQGRRLLVIALVQIDEKTGVIRYARAMKEHADNVWVWMPTEDQKRTGQFPIHQIKGRDSGLCSFEVQANWEMMTFFDAGAVENLSDIEDADGSQVITKSEMDDD